MTKTPKKTTTKKSVNKSAPKKKVANRAPVKKPAPKKAAPATKAAKVEKYSGNARILLDLNKGKNKHAKDPKSAMHCVQNAIRNGDNTIDKAIVFFMANWSSPRRTKKNNQSFARGYVIGAIRENYITLK